MRRTQLTTGRTRIHILLEYTNLMGSICTALALLFLVVSCLAQGTEPALPVPRFEDVSKLAGLTVPHNSTPEKRYILESMSGGVGFIDCDNDGKLDIITVNGSSVDRYRQGGDLMITLYRQLLTSTTMAGRTFTLPAMAGTYCIVISETASSKT